MILSVSYSDKIYFKSRDNSELWIITIFIIGNRSTFLIVNFLISFTILSRWYAARAKLVLLSLQRFSICIFFSLNTFRLASQISQLNRFEQIRIQWQIEFLVMNVSWLNRCKKKVNWFHLVYKHSVSNWVHSERLNIERIYSYKFEL